MSLIEGSKPQENSPLKRASTKFEARNKGQVDVSELQIENDRIKTTLMILTQKLKLKEDDQKGQEEKI